MTNSLIQQTEIKPFAFDPVVSLFSDTKDRPRTTWFAQITEVFSAFSTRLTIAVQVATYTSWTSFSGLFDFHHSWLQTARDQLKNVLRHEHRVSLCFTDYFLKLGDESSVMGIRNIAYAFQKRISRLSRNPVSNLIFVLKDTLFRRYRNSSIVRPSAQITGSAQNYRVEYRIQKMPARFHFLCVAKQAGKSRDRENVSELLPNFPRYIKHKVSVFR